MSTLPGILAALVAKATAVVPAGTTVYDGAPPEQQALPSNYLVIGSALSAPTGQTPAPTFFLGGDMSSEEQITIECYSRAQSGDTDIAWCRNAAWSSFWALKMAVQVDRQLSGAITGGDWITPDGYDYSQTSEEDLMNADVTGRFAHIDFRFTATLLIEP